MFHGHTALNRLMVSVTQWGRIVVLAIACFGLAAHSLPRPASAQTIPQEIEKLADVWLRQLERLLEQGRFRKPVRIFVPLAEDEEWQIRCSPLAEYLKTEFEKALTRRSERDRHDLMVISHASPDQSSFIARLKWRREDNGDLTLGLSVGHSGPSQLEHFVLDQARLPREQLKKTHRNCLVTITAIDERVRAQRMLKLRLSPRDNPFKYLADIQKDEQFWVLGQLTDGQGIIADFEKVNSLTGERRTVRGFVAMRNEELQTLLRYGTSPSAGSALERPRTRDDTPIASYEPGSDFRDCEACPRLIVVPAGRYMMGSPKDQTGRSTDEGPRRTITFSAPFAIGETEIQFAEWEACMDAGGCGPRRPSDFGWGRADRPIVDVSYDDAKAYVKWLSEHTGRTYRLPSEAEWEYAAKGNRDTRYPWGDVMIPQRAAATIGRRRATATLPVGGYEPNAFGLYDTAGNVWEWVADCWRETLETVSDDGKPGQDSECTHRSIRGGSFSDDPLHLRAANRNYAHHTARAPTLGFRVVAEIEAMQ